jgi:hypothetical protein
MVAVIGCESNFTHYRADGTVLRGRVTPADSGAAQINKTYHEEAAKALGYDVDTLWGNLAYARHLYDAQGESPWVCSRIVAKAN